MNINHNDWMLANNPTLKSWVESANEKTNEFPIQNLPFGIFNTPDNPIKRIGIAIGDYIVDLVILKDAGIIDTPKDILTKPQLNEFIALGQTIWRTLRLTISFLLQSENPQLRDNFELRNKALVLIENSELFLPVNIPGYTDFYSSKEHATNVGKMFRSTENALLPNWVEIPIGYNGRASSIIVSGTDFKRPNGQIKFADQIRPIFSPCKKLDVELEMGFIIGKETELGDPIKCESAENYIFGMVLLNDWSARDIQQWENVPLGPFNSKGFATTISPWVVTLDALAPFRCLQPEQHPKPLEYLQQQGEKGFNIELQIDLRTQNSEEIKTISKTNFKYMYWTISQQLTHHTVSGCNVRIGDLMGSGTISGDTQESCGSLLEITKNGQYPIKISENKEYIFIEDGDEIILRGWCEGNGYRVGFGPCSGKILPAI